MTKIFLKSLKIENYKRFKEFSLDEMNIPNGNQGSGLNVLIGENGLGKTSILEAVNFLTQSKYSSENKLSISDFNDYNQDIKITGITDIFKCKSSIDFNNTASNSLHFKSNGISFEAKTRKIKEANKLLSTPFAVKNFFLTEGKNYYKEDTSKGEIDSRDLIFSDSRIIDGSIDVFFFDKNRSKHLTSGTYKTTFDKICDDLNWKFIKNLPDNLDEIIKNISGEFFQNTLNIAQKNVGKKLAEETSRFFEDDVFKNLKIDLLDILQPFSGASLVLREENNPKQINARNFGSGIEIIITLLLLKAMSAGTKNSSIIYLIDEPELHLHPKAQESLARILLEESKDKQIIISTHSPYIFKELLPSSALFILKKQKSGEITNQRESRSGNGLLPWSPSWGEVNYTAYDMETIEFHNELYGYLMELSGKYKIEDFEKFFKEQKINTNSKEWKRKNKEEVKTEQVSLHTFIRHSIHHPENNLNQKYSAEEMKSSIDEMISIIKRIKTTTNLTESKTEN